MTLSGATTQCLSGPGSNGNEGTATADWVGNAFRYPCMGHNIHQALKLIFSVVHSSLFVIWLYLWMNWLWINTSPSPSEMCFPISLTMATSKTHQLRLNFADTHIYLIAMNINENNGMILLLHMHRHTKRYFAVLSIGWPMLTSRSASEGDVFCKP